MFFQIQYRSSIRDGGNNVNGLFITIEGPDGAGKTSILNELFPLLKEVAKTEIIQTREPGGIPIAEEIRAVILDPKMIGWMNARKHYFMRRQEDSI